MGLPGEAAKWNHLLMNERKANRLKSLLNSKRTTFPGEVVDQYGYACEIAVQLMEETHATSLDHILCDPKLAAELDRRVLAMAHREVVPRLSPLRIRWSLLGLRKRINASFRAYATRIRDTALRFLPEPKRASADRPHDAPSEPGLYLLHSGGKPLYVGETLDLRQRMEFQLGSNTFDFWNTTRANVQVAYRSFPAGASRKFGQANQSLLIGRLRPRGNYARLGVVDSGAVPSASRSGCRPR
jgi:hypothetical protein